MEDELSFDEEESLKRPMGMERCEGKTAVHSGMEAITRASPRDQAINRTPRLSSTGGGQTGSGEDSIAVRTRFDTGTDQFSFLRRIGQVNTTKQ